MTDYSCWRKNCCNVQAAVGFDVTFQWRRRREACSMITKMYRTRKLAGDRHTEIAGHDGRCVIAQKGAPALITAASEA